MTTEEGTAAGWYEDPAKVGELRYYDGSTWTDHVTVDGVQTTAPFAAPSSPSATAPSPSSFTLRRVAQSRTDEEESPEVIGPTSGLGHFVAHLDGAPGYRFEAAKGGTVLAVSKPSLKNAVEVANPEGQVVGTITRVGRLHSRYDVRQPDRQEIATVKLAQGTADAWEVQFEGAAGATITRTVTSPADPMNLAGADYAVSITATLDDEQQRLLLAVPLAIDILDTQAL